MLRDGTRERVGSRSQKDEGTEISFHSVEARVPEQWWKETATRGGPR